MIVLRLQKNNLFYPNTEKNNKFFNRLNLNSMSINLIKDNLL